MADAERLTARSGNKELDIDFLQDETLLDALRRAGVYLSAPCGGQGRCGKCRVHIQSGAPAPTDTDARILSAEELAEGYRLACATRPAARMCVEVPADGEDRFDAQEGYQAGGELTPALQWREVNLPKTPQSLAKTLGATSPTLPFLRSCSAVADAELHTIQLARSAAGPLAASAARQPLYGVAVDIGTTTLAMELVELASGSVAARHSAVNRQRAFGADVISRIVRANEGDLGPLSDSIRGQLAEGLRTLCAQAGIDPASLLRVAIAANTTMLHLLLGLSCRHLGAYPFTPVTLEQISFRWCEIFEPISGCDAEVVILPGISTYVGADITAGLLLTGIHRLPPDQSALLVDIGTNGEMALAHGGRILCTSTAAGPAFEGGNIGKGTGSVPGAICAVRPGPGGGFEVETIGDEPPAGICGTGVIDAVAACLHTGALEPSGRYAKEIGKEGVLLAKDPSGDEIRFSQKDVRELQFAKSAIRSGIDVLLGEAGLAYEDVHTLYLAGGFGYRIRPESAVAIGLLPQSFLQRTVTLGNASLGGAARLLTDAGADTALRAITGMASEFSLSENKNFNDLFIQNASFPGDGEQAKEA